MNQMKIPPIVTSFEMDKSIQQQMFIQNQSDLNEFIKKNHKNNNYYNKAEEITGMSSANIPDMSRVKFNESVVDSRIQGKMLEDQMRLKVLESEYDLQKAKIEDEHNAKTFSKKYPYGKQNVKITEEVIDKYSMNTYLNQSQMLKKFEEEAKKRKQQKNNRRRAIQINSWSADKLNVPLNNNYNSARSANKRTSILQRQMNKLYEAKMKYLAQASKAQKVQKLERKPRRKEYSRQKENKKLDNIENMLKEVRQKLDLNISTLNQKQNQRLRHINFQKWVQISRDRMEKLSELAKQQDFYRRKVPVVIYNNQKNSEKNYFSRIVCPDIDSYERKENIDKPEEFNEVIHIYNLNKKRMDQLSQKIAIQENKSIF